MIFIFLLYAHNHIYNSISTTRCQESRLETHEILRAGNYFTFWLFRVVASQNTLAQLPILFQNGLLLIHYHEQMQIFPRCIWVCRHFHQLIQYTEKRCMLFSTMQGNRKDIYRDQLMQQPPQFRSSKILLIFIHSPTRSFMQVVFNM